MQLREGEKILYTYYHHFLPFFWRIVQLAAASIPVFLLTYALSKVLSDRNTLIVYGVVFGIFFFTTLYITFIYWLDKLVVTSQRVIHIDWKLLTARVEIETEIVDIQDIRTHSKGIFSIIPLFNFGEVGIESASYTATINFTEAPDPEEIRNSIHTIRKNYERVHRRPMPDPRYAGIDTYDIIPRDESRTTTRAPENPIR